MSGYTLVVCEKPDAARRVSESLSGGNAASSSVKGVTVFRFRVGAEDFVVCAAQGHLFTVSDPFAERSVYPIFDLEWFGKDLVKKDVVSVARRIEAIRDLAKGADRFVNACDYDVEGETIGFNILRYACGGKEDAALRARFSALTKEDVVKAFGSLEARVGHGMAEAGRARHAVDFAYGVNLSRALSQSTLANGGRYKTFSIGRVQGPTLRFVVERELEIETFVPRPFWSLACSFEKGGQRIVAHYLKGKLDRKVDAERVQSECSGMTGVVERVRTSASSVAAPPPFNVGDLQKEAYRAFGYTPSRTLQIAERLYLDALISYPRTGSQRLPESIGYERILQRLGAQVRYAELTAALLAGKLNPVQGPVVDPAHPAIHPTGEKPAKRLDLSEARVYDLVVKRFLAAFAPPVRRENMSAEVSVCGHLFGIDGSKILEPGWLSYYSPYGNLTETEVPGVKEGEKLPVFEIKSEEKFEAPPKRYSQGSLLEKMEREGIGTKATRADIITTLLTRGYVSGGEMRPSGLGFSVVEILKRHAPGIVSTELTKVMESGLERVEGGAGDAKKLLREVIESVSKQLVSLEFAEEDVGRALGSAGTDADGSSATGVLGACPVCRSGKLHVVKSKKSGKRFVGCTNYSLGCRASAPLPQRGKLKPATNPCKRCYWPVVCVIAGRRPWSFCINPDCPSKGVKGSEVRAV